MRYHRPDSRNYGATVAEIWFDSDDSAEGAGFTLANTHPASSERVVAPVTAVASLMSADGSGPAGSHAPLAGGGAPAGFVIKGNVDSMRYHRPDSRNYGATVAEIWFDSDDSAEGAGFTLANTHPASSERVIAPLSGVASLMSVDGSGPAGSHAPLAGGGAPAGFVIKGNVDSMRYHRPDSRSYGATVAEIWFDSDDNAEAAGFTLANSHPASSERIVAP